MANILSSIAKVYNFALDQQAGTWENFYNVGSPEKITGSEWEIILLLGVSVIAALIYYFVVAAKLRNATAANYFITFGISLLTMLLLTFFLLPVIVHCPISDIWDMNLLKFSLLTIFYYTLLFEVFSLVFMNLSRDKHRHLFGSF